LGYRSSSSHQRAQLTRAADVARCPLSASATISRAGYAADAQPVGRRKSRRYSTCRTDRSSLYVVKTAHSERQSTASKTTEKCR
jgi:hypothetical protein